MNTKLNNWFIHPEYKETTGIYSQCISFKSYKSIFNITNQCFYNYRIFLGCYNDDLDTLLNHNGTNNGDTHGYFSTTDEPLIPREISFSQSECDSGLFIDIDEFLLFYDNDYYYDGSGDGDGNGYTDGFSES